MGMHCRVNTPFHLVGVGVAGRHVIGDVEQFGPGPVRLTCETCEADNVGVIGLIIAVVNRGGLSRGWICRPLGKG